MNLNIVIIHRMSEEEIQTHPMNLNIVIIHRMSNETIRVTNRGVSEIHL